MLRNCKGIRYCEHDDITKKNQAVKQFFNYYYSLVFNLNSNGGHKLHVYIMI